MKWITLAVFFPCATGMIFMAFEFVFQRFNYRWLDLDDLLKCAAIGALLALCCELIMVCALIAWWIVS